MKSSDVYYANMQLAFSMSRFAKTPDQIIALERRFHYYRHKYEQAKAREAKSQPQEEK